MSKILYDDYIHPELQSGEVFFSNMTNDMFLNFSSKSKRKGIRTFDGKGIEFHFPGYSPVFVSAEEINSKENLFKLRKEFRNT